MKLSIEVMQEKAVLLERFNRECIKLAEELTAAGCKVEVYSPPIKSASLVNCYPPPDRFYYRVMLKLGT
jgi:hypothetical protein